MKKSDVRFDELREFLKELGFREIPEDQPRVRFDHPSGSVLLFRPYKGKEKVSARDMLVTGIQLVDQGLVHSSDFERFQQKAPA
jgi:hypothetical protein